MVKSKCLNVLYILHLLSTGAVGDPEKTANGGMTRSEQDLLGKYLLQRLLGKTDLRGQESVARIAERAAFDDLLASASVVYPEYESDTAVEDIDYEYIESDAQEPELKQPSQTINTIVPAPTRHKTDHKYPYHVATSSRFSMPLTTLGVKKYYLGIFFKANWARSAQYCRHQAADGGTEDTKGCNGCQFQRANEASASPDGDRQSHPGPVHGV